MDKIIRGITGDGYVKAWAESAAGICERMRNIHKTLPVGTAALGRTLIAASLMGSDLKAENGSVTLQIRGGGPLGAMTAVSDSHGNVRGYVQNPAVDIPLRDDGKLDVGTAVGADGILTVIRDIGEKEPFAGKVGLLSGEIAEDIAVYFAESEQIPTVCALGVLIDKDQSVKCAGGYIIQLMPGAPDELIEKLEKKVREAGSVTKMLERGMSEKEMLFEILGDLDFEVLSEGEVKYECKCSKKRVEQALLSMGKEELEKIVADGKPINITCQFCDAQYNFSQKDIKNLLTFRK